MNQEARTSTTYKIEGELRGPDGYVCRFDCDDGFRSWWAIVRWNVHYRHWRVLLGHNLPDLFRKVLRSKF